MAIPNPSNSTECGTRWNRARTKLEIVRMVPRNCGHLHECWKNKRSPQIPSDLHWEMAMANHGSSPTPLWLSKISSVGIIAKNSTSANTSASAKEMFLPFLQLIKVLKPYLQDYVSKKWSQKEYEGVNEALYILLEICIFPSCAILCEPKISKNKLKTFCRYDTCQSVCLF